MSTKRYLLVAFLLCAAFFVFAETNIFEHNSGFLVTGASQNLTYYEQTYLNYDYQLNPHLKLNAADDMNFLDTEQAVRNQHLQNNLSLGAEYRDSLAIARVEYRNTVFGKSKRLMLYRDVDPSVEYTKNALHSVVLGSELDMNYLVGRVHARGRFLQYSPVTTLFNDAWEPYDSLMADAVNSDVMLTADFRYTPLRPFYLNAGIDYRDNLDEAKTMYDIAMPKLGVGVADRIWKLDLKAECNWQYRDSRNVADEARNLLVSDVRASIRLVPQASAYINLINNGCYDNHNNRYLLISNYLRAHLQYRFNYDPSSGSYVLAGGKYSPENKADAMFLETDMLTLRRLYLGGVFNYQPDRQTEYSARITYYLLPWSDVHISYSHRDNDFSRYEYDYVSIGSKIVF